MKKFNGKIVLILAMLLAVLVLCSCETDVPGEGEGKIVEIDLYAINDLHGKFFDGNGQPGVDEMTTYLKNAVASNENTVIFSSGDMWQGSAESGLTQGKIMTEWMNDLDFEFMTLGNHEFDWGDSYIYANEAIAEFPFLAINVYDEETRSRADFCESSTVVDFGDVQVGFIGAIGDCYSSISGESSEGYYFVVGYELTNLVKDESEKLREAGADIIVYSVHDGIDEYDDALSRGGYVDIVFEGHTHSSYVRTDKYGVYHLQGGGDNSGMSYAQIDYDTSTGQIKVDAARSIKSSEYGKGEDDPIVSVLAEKYADKVSIIDEPLGYNNSQKNSNYLKKLVAAMYTRLADDVWDKYDIVLGGGFISCRSPGRLEAGDVTYGDLYMLFPFDNKLAVCSCKGSDLLRNYVNTTNNNYFVSYTGYGEQVKDSIDPDATYYIITDSYNYTYAPNRLTVVEILDNTTYARDLVADYVKNGGLGQRPEPDPNAPEADTQHSIKTLVDYIATLPKGAQTDAKYYVSGTITSIVSSTYGNCYITDETGETLYIYGMQKDGVNFASMDEKPKVGDKITLCGALMHYVDTSGNSVYEMVNGELQ